MAVRIGEAAKKTGEGERRKAWQRRWSGKRERFSCTKQAGRAVMRTDKGTRKGGSLALPGAFERTGRSLPMMTGTVSPGMMVRAFLCRVGTAARRRRHERGKFSNEKMEHKGKSEEYLQRVHCLSSLMRLLPKNCTCRVPLFTPRRAQLQAILGKSLKVKAGPCTVEPLACHFHMEVDEVVEGAGGVALSQLQVTPDSELYTVCWLSAEIQIPALFVLPRFGGINREPAGLGQMELRSAMVAADLARGTVVRDEKADLEASWNALSASTRRFDPTLWMKEPLPSTPVGLTARVRYATTSAGEGENKTNTPINSLPA